MDGIPIHDLYNWAYKRRKLRILTTSGHVKTFSPDIVSIDGSSKAHCFATGNIADTADSPSPPHQREKERELNLYIDYWAIMVIIDKNTTQGTNEQKQLLPLDILWAKEKYLIYKCTIFI